MSVAGVDAVLKDAIPGKSPGLDGILIELYNKQERPRAGIGRCLHGYRELGKGLREYGKNRWVCWAVRLVRGRVLAATRINPTVAYRGGYQALEFTTSILELCSAALG